MPVFNAKLQGDLDQLVDMFTKRQQWWDQTIARAETIREKHRQESRQRAEELAHAKMMADSFTKGFQTIIKRSTPESDNLHGAYQQQTGLKDFTDNPLRGLPISSPASLKASFNPLYGKKFWARYEKHVKAGHHNLAEGMLKSADGPLRRAMIYLHRRQKPRSPPGATTSPPPVRSCPRSARRGASCSGSIKRSPRAKRTPRRSSARC